MLDAEYLPSLLVVEEVTAERIALVELLQNQPSYRVYSAGKRAAALEILAKQKIGLVIATVRKPYEDSLALICRVGEAYPDVGIIAVSADKVEEEGADRDASIRLDAALRLGATRALRKPVRAEEWFEAVEAVLAGRAGLALPR